LALMARIADLLATVSLVGISAFARPSRPVATIAFVAALVLPLLRVLLQAGVLAQAGHFPATLALVALDTRYGQVMLTRAAIVALWFLARDRRAAVLGLAVLDVAALSLLGHGAASDTPLLGALVLGLHIGAATVWLAGMAAALFGIVKAPAGVSALRGFAPLGLACVSLLAATGLLNLQILTGNIVSAFTGSYGAILIAKLICFGAMLALAAVNRFALLPRLDHAADRPAAAAHRAMLALAAETLLGAVVIGLAALRGRAAPVV
jgi:putative copper resistance protein D